MFGAHRDMRAIVVLYFGLILLLPDHSYAKRIYKSIDEEGNVTYSASPPENARQIEKLFIPESSQSGAVSANTSHDEIRAAAEELEEDRKQREQERENARIKAEEQEARQQAQQPVVEHHHYYPVVPLYHHRHHRPRPARHPRHPPEHRPPRPRGYQYKPALSLGPG
jgi:hypothetical protein